MADRAEENRFEPPQFIGRVGGQHLAGFEVTIAAEIVVLPVEFETEFLSGHFANLQRLSRNFRASAVAADYRHVVSVHGSFVPRPKVSGGRAMLGSNAEIGKREVEWLCVQLES